MIAQSAGKIREQIALFSGNLSRGLCKAARRLVSEVLYGIQARQSVHLSEIVRSLEESIPAIKTENRLSRNMARPEIREVLQPALAQAGACRIGQDTLLVLDLSDLVKPYAAKMENLARVRDGSAKKLANGYWTCHVIGVENEGQEITPLYGELYSQEAEDFVSENDEILRAIRGVSKATDRRGVWVIDRGGDRRRLYDELVPPDNGLRFIIRQKGDRHLLFGMRKLAAHEIAQNCSLPYATTIVREEKNRERTYCLEFGFCAVRLPEYPDVPLWMVVVTGFGTEPMMLLTNIPQRKNRNVLWQTATAYLTRWRIEETIRFAKQCYRLEDIRVLKYDRLRNMVVLVTAAMFFAAVILGTKTKLDILCAHALKAAKRLFGIPDFRYYAIADGIREILTRCPRRKTPAPAMKDREQLLMFYT